MTHAEAIAELNVAANANAAEIKSAYRRRSLQTHPDKGGSDAAFARTTAAYEILTGKRKPAVAAAASSSSTSSRSTAGQAKAAPKSKPAAGAANAGQVAALREAWLVRAIEELRKLAGFAGVAIPSVRVSVGYGRGGRRKLSAVIPSIDTADGMPQFFISPELVNVPAVLAELVTLIGEVVADADAAKIVAELFKAARPQIIAALGAYPHAAVTGATAKKDGTRLIKISCKCGYNARITRKWANVGMPVCPCGRTMVEA